ncbi:electron transfer flavoprotein subunit alpha/FixB family protein [Halobacterium yunchengense]|uniref:electron transfer flavoprotein subunit alpha/FixB family protein n=1 Tax=Halobacterium yunchengense TaxID=3108497 RepID=UPI003009AB9E
MVLAVVEHDEGGVADSSLEAVTFARELAAQTDAGVDAVAFDGDGDALADDLADYGVGDLRVVVHDRFDRYAPEARAESLDQVLDDGGHRAVVAPGTDRGHEVLAHVAARREVSMVTNCLDATVDGDEYEVTRQRWGGSLLEEARVTGGPKLLTAAEHEVGAEPAADATAPDVSTFEPALDDDDFRVQVDRYEESDTEGVPLGEARVVVGGGRGVGGPEDYDKLEELADLLGGTVGASRAAVNEGWRPHDDQVGQTGAKISPKLYIACGISGAVQHMVGCKGAENILAINTDPEAAIVQKADYAVVADLHEVVPALNDAIRERQ